MTDSNDYDDVEDSAVDEDEAQAAEKAHQILLIMLQVMVMLPKLKHLR